jgi:hypothetical protein
MKCKYFHITDAIIDKALTLKDKQDQDYYYFIMTEVFVLLHDGKDYCNKSCGGGVNE